MINATQKIRRKKKDSDQMMNEKQVSLVQNSKKD